jgi:secreted trypsin-like serine protease
MSALRTGVLGWVVAATLAAMSTAVHAQVFGQGHSPQPAFDEAVYLKSEPPPSRTRDFSGTSTGPNDEGSEVLTRIVGGHPAPQGKWPSMVALYRRVPDHNPSFFCGGTVIDAEWVLTAAHCLVTKDSGGKVAGVRPPADLIVREGTSNLDTGGRGINVREIIIHPEYSQTQNDVALIRLAEPAEAPRQQMLAKAAMPQLLAAGRMATTMGFGMVQPLKVNTSREDMSKVPRSQQLLQVDVPIVAKDKCATTYKQKVATGATLCAGLDEGGKDTCPGDSGGPLFVRDGVGQALQAGVVSFGYGCAQPMIWGVYASVGHFEDWIRSHVGNASFGGGQAGAAASPAAAGANQQLQTLVGGQAAAAPSQSGVVTVDIVQGEQVRIGRLVQVRVTSSVAGQLLLLNRNAKGETVQLYPNGRSLNRLMAAGGSMRVPGQHDGFTMPVGPPAGPNEVIAVIVPEGVPIEDLTRANEGFRTIPDLSAMLQALSTRRRDLGRDQGRDLAVVDKPKFTVGSRVFTVVGP